MVSRGIAAWLGSLSEAEQTEWSTMAKENKAKAERGEDVFDAGDGLFQELQRVIKAKGKRA